METLDNKYRIIFFTVIFFMLHGQKKEFSYSDVTKLPTLVQGKIRKKLIEPALDYISSTTYCQSIIFPHYKSVISAKIAPDEKRRFISICQDDPHAYLWNINPQERQCTIIDHQRPVRYVGFSSAGNKIYTADNKMLKIWNAHGNITNKIRVTNHHHITSIVFHPKENALLLVGLEAGQARLYNIHLAKFSSFTESKNSTYLRTAFNSTGTKIITATNQNKITLWDTKPKKVIRSFPTIRPAVQLFFSKNDQFFFSNHNYQVVQLWDQRSEKPIFTTTPIVNSTLYNVAMNPNCLEMCTVKNNDLVIWDLRMRKRQATLRGHKLFIVSLHYNHDGSKLLSSSWDNTAKLWDTKLQRFLTTLAYHSAPIYNAQFLKNSSLILSHSEDGNVIIGAPNGIPNKIARMAEYLNIEQVIALQSAFKIFADKKIPTLPRNSEMHKELLLLPRLFYRFCLDNLRIKIIAEQKRKN